MIVLKVRKIGNSLGVVLPREALAALRVGEDDTLYLTEAPDGFRITPHDPEFQEQMKIGRQILKKHRAVLRALAQS